MNQQQDGIKRKKPAGYLKPIIIGGLVYFVINFVMRDSVRDMGRQAAVQDVRQECLTEGAPTGFENALWLMTKGEVKELFPDAKPFRNQDSLLTETTAFDRPARVGFEFDNDHLTMIIINFITRSEDKAAYQNTHSLLIKKYGAFSEPLQTPKYTLISKRKFSRVNIEHLLYTLNGVPAEQVLMYRTKNNSN